MVRAAAVLLAACLPVTAASHWWKHPDLTVPSLLGIQSELRDFGAGASLPQLQAACEADARCLAFTSTGSLKNYTNTTTDAVGTDLYVKHARPQPASGLPWPLPAAVSRGKGTVCVGTGFTLATAAALQPSAVLSAAFTRYRALIVGAHTGSCAAASDPELTSLSVAFGPGGDLQLGVDESYNLTVPAGGGVARLTARTEIGVLRGLRRIESLCTTAHPRYTRLTKIIGISMSEATMRPNSRWRRSGM